MDERKPIIYIAGKMRGLPDYGRPRFYEAAAMLESKGYIVLNPAALPVGMPDEKYMPICLSMLEAADSIYMLDGWLTSSGANVELAYALLQNKDVLFEGYDPFEEQNPFGDNKPTERMAYGSKTNNENNGAARPSGDA